MKRKWQRFLLMLALALSVPAMASTGSGYTQTRYPIVLVHGLFGFGQILGVDYFYQVPAALKTDGAQVFVAQVSATGSNEQRGEQLLQQVQQILAITGATKVNLIGHSQGAPTARYVAGVRPDLVASVTSVGGVNRGSTVADVVSGLAPDGSVSRVVALAAAKALGTLLAFFSGSGDQPQQPLGALNSLTTSGSLAFSAKFPGGVPNTACGEGDYQANGINYYSWTGSATATNVLDPLSGPVGALGLVFGSTPSDGLVATCSAHLGQVIRDNYHMNHVNEINQSFGLVDPFEVSPVTLYRQQANRLKNAGL
ncbi:lipase family alpha/beta hydrolase [Paludibacterium purpuratum]|uniref:Triacylglycerol lipase n=1 Tax=Paludibacterium purpuratum TaxID=1144873 RepID=A0A4R7B1L0_9NEIS|nr:triacylglycerol lipase [Paludibacterium purpuratum]TDR73326.1 triacylglycerol lipase [Paludibacterium purpuratum]